MGSISALVFFVQELRHKALIQFGNVKHCGMNFGKMSYRQMVEAVEKEVAWAKKSNTGNNSAKTGSL